jgi:hypothetical protein
MGTCNMAWLTPDEAEQLAKAILVAVEEARR